MSDVLAYARWVCRGAQEDGREVLLLQPRGEQVHLRAPVSVDTLEYVDQVILGVGPVRAAGQQDALQEPDILGTDLGPAESPRFVAHGNGPQRPLQLLRVDGGQSWTPETGQGSGADKWNLLA